MDLSMTFLLHISKGLEKKVLSYFGILKLGSFRHSKSKLKFEFANCVTSFIVSNDVKRMSCKYLMKL